jgi:FixJ family two-component response regulator
MDPRPLISVVDDDESVRESLELLVKFAGWQPETFASAKDFLADLVKTAVKLGLAPAKNPWHSIDH